MKKRRIGAENAPLATQSPDRRNIRLAGGGSGIRTHDTVSRIHAFQASAFSHSAIPPGNPSLKGDAAHCKARAAAAVRGAIRATGQFQASWLCFPITRISPWPVVQAPFYRIVAIALRLSPIEP